MRFYFEPSRAQLKVFSAICSNLAAFWFAAIFATRDPLTLTLNVVAAIVSAYLAIKAEELTEEYD